MKRAAAELITVEDYRAMPGGPPYYQLIDPHLVQIHRYEFAIDVAKPVRIVDSEESFETALFPGLAVNAVDVFKR